MAPIQSGVCRNVDLARSPESPTWRRRAIQIPPDQSLLPQTFGAVRSKVPWRFNKLLRNRPDRSRVSVDLGWLSPEFRDLSVLNRVAGLLIFDRRHVVENLLKAVMVEPPDHVANSTSCDGTRATANCGRPAPERRQSELRHKPRYSCRCCSANLVRPAASGSTRATSPQIFRATDWIALKRRVVEHSEVAIYHARDPAGELTEKQKSHNHRHGQKHACY